MVVRIGHRRNQFDCTHPLPGAAGLVRHGLGTIFMPASEAGRFPDLRAMPLRPALVWPIFPASAGQAQIGPASAKLADLLLASAAATSPP
jgi:hypothetical protein